MSFIFTQLLFFYTISESAIYYVNPSHTNPSDNGNTWNTPFNSLPEALTNAFRSGDEIWLLGDHTYYPSTASRFDCFISSMGITIYGGFTGTETSISQRIDTTPSSIISGDIGTIGDNSDNCYHVITYDRELTLDNVIISNGNANWNDNFNSQINTLHAYGGALITSDSTKYSQLNLYNVTFKDNQAINGGALFFAGSPMNVIDINIENCKFINNVAINGQYEGGYGGAIYLYHLAKVIITNTIFINNNAKFRGGAVYIDYGGVFNCDNCIFDGNTVDGYGGVIFAEDRNSQTSGTFPVIQNSIFRNNKADIKGNNILYFNGVIGTMIDNIFDDLNAIVLINSELTAQSNVNDIYIYNEDVITFTGLDEDLIFDINVELNELGNNAMNINTDLIQWVDETNVCYVSVNGNNIDGLSWHNAYNQLQDCIDIIGINGGEIWVQSGIYYPNIIPDWKQRVGKISNMHKSFVLYDNVRIYGGFNGEESKREDRDWVHNPTYLSCDLGNVECNEIMIAADGVLIDGFIFKDAGLGTHKRRRNLLANSIDIGMILSSTSGNSGSGIYSNSTTINVVNSIFLQLFSTGKGGAIYCIGQQGLDSTNIKSPTFINVAFLGNRANMRGGAISADAFCHFTCKYCKFDSNSCANKGGSIYLDFESKPTIENSQFNNNFAGESGGCIAEDGKSFTTFNGNINFTNNTAIWEGGCLYSGSGVGANIQQGFSFEQTPIFNDNSVNNGIGQSDIYGWPFTQIDMPQMSDNNNNNINPPETTVADSNTVTPPNFIIFVIDDILWSSSWIDFAPNGVELNGKTISYIDVDTPNIQRIIDEGIRFSRVYANPKCTPSRFTMLTGRYAVRSEWGIERTLKTSLGIQGTNVTIQTSKLLYNDGIYNIPNMLKTIGNYYTGFVGKWHLMTTDDNGYDYNCASLLDTPNITLYELCTSVVKQAGFDFVDGFYHSNIDNNDYYNHNPEWMVERSQTFIDSSIENNQPFFLYFASTLTHTPLAYDAMFNYGIDHTPKGILSGNDIPYNTGMTSRDIIWNKVLEYDAKNNNKMNSLAAYLWLDDSLGALIKYLKDKQLYDNTFILLTNDNGMGAKGSLYEQGGRIMQFVRYPKLFGTNGYTMDDTFVIGNVDIAATIFDVAGISNNLPSEYIMDSQSWLQDVINYIESDHIQTITDDNYRFIDIFNSHAIISSDYMYLFRATSTMEIDNDVRSLYKYSMDKEQLYSLNDDPNQQNNMINDDNMKDIVYKFRTRMIDYIITAVCYVDNKDECIIPELTYIPVDSEWKKATPSPTQVINSDIFSCKEVIYWQYTWRRVQDWNEDEYDDIYLSDALSVFLSKKQYSDCGEISSLQYLYDFIYSTPRRLDVDMIFCCGINAQFGDGYDIPNGYKQGKYINDAYVDDDDDVLSIQNWIVIKEGLVIGIIVLLCLCCVGVIFIWKCRNKNKDIQMEIVEDDEMNIIPDDTVTVSSLKINTKLHIINNNSNDNTPSDNVKQFEHITPFEIETKNDCITLTYCVEDNGEM